MKKTTLLDHGYIQLIEHWGSDERIIEAARMSVDKGFEGWGPKCRKCGNTATDSTVGARCNFCSGSLVAGDERLLGHLWRNKHATPFEMAGCIVEVKAPIMVFREWHRHRTQCLAGDTLVHFDAPKSDKYGRRSVYKLTMEQLWERWQLTTRKSRPERQTNAFFKRKRVQQMRLRVLDEEKKEVIVGSIYNVIKGEIKPMLKVTTASGRSITATKDHRFLTNAGWLPLGEAIQLGALLTLEGTTRACSQRWERPEINESSERWEPVLGWEQLYEVSSEGRVRRLGCPPKKLTAAATGYDVVSLNRPGEQVTKTVHTLVLEAFKGPKPPNCEALHANHNRGDNRLENLSWGSSKDNSRDMVQEDRQQRLVPVFEEIVSVESAGELQSYDLTVGPTIHNFVANGFVVHNSYNEMSARYTPLPAEDYIPSVERLMLNAKEAGKNKQAGTIKGADVLTEDEAKSFQEFLREHYNTAQMEYEHALKVGVPKELARVHLPVGRYSRMRASANLRNWLAFCLLRQDPHAQWEIRQYANALGDILQQLFPRTYELYMEGRPF